MPDHQPPEDQEPVPPDAAMDKQLTTEEIVNTLLVQLSLGKIRPEVALPVIGRLIEEDSPAVVPSVDSLIDLLSSKSSEGGATTRICKVSSGWVPFGEFRVLPARASVPHAGFLGGGRPPLQRDLQSDRYDRGLDLYSEEARDLP